MMSFPSNIEYYNPNMMAFSPSEAEDDASHEEDTPSPSPKRTQRKLLPFVPSNLEHFQPPAADSETASLNEPKRETKRRKANGSSKPVPIHAVEGQDATAAATKTSTSQKGSSRRLREVQVFSQSGEMMYAFPNCAEAARKMDITRSRINRACLQGGAVVDGMLYKYADPTDALPALPLADDEMDEMEFEYYQH